jgi:anti-anti-sigma factor
MSHGHLTSHVRRESGTPRLALEGTIDIETAPQALAILQRHMEEHGPTLVVDASRVHFIDSRGVGALLQAGKAARDAGGQLYLYQPTLPVEKILDVCGLTSFFPSPPGPEPAAEAQPPAADARRRPARGSRPGA